MQNLKPKTPAAIGNLLVLALVPLLSACGWFQQEPDIHFLEYGSDYSSKPFFARVEHSSPLTANAEGRRQLALVTPKYLAGLDQEKVDQIYARLSAGPVPDGPFDGDLFFPKGSSGKLRASEIVSGLKSLAVRLKGKKLEILGSVLWKGKVFYPDEMILRNRIEDLAILAPVIDDMLSVPKIEVNGRDSWLLAAPGGAAAAGRAEPARWSPRIDNHRLCVHGRDTRVPGKAGFSCRPARFSGTR